MSSVTTQPENFPNEIIDTFLAAQLRYPQILTGTFLAMGDKALSMVMQDEYSWDRLLTDTMSAEQLDRAANVISTAHGSIPVRPGPEGRNNWRREGGIEIFPRDRINSLVQDKAHVIGAVVGNMAYSLLSRVPKDSSRDILAVLQRPDYLPSMTLATSLFFNAGHQSLSASTATNRAIRSDLHRSHRDRFNKTPDEEQHLAIEATLDTISVRMDAVVLDGLKGVIPKAEQVLGRRVPQAFQVAFLKKAVHSTTRKKLMQDGYLKA